LALDETVETVLCAIAQFTDDFAFYLAGFGEAMGSTASLAPVAHFLVLTCKYVLTPYDLSWVRNAWWEGCQYSWQQLLVWIEDPATARIAQNTLELAHASGVSIDARSSRPTRRALGMSLRRSSGSRIGLRRPRHDAVEHVVMPNHDPSAVSY
jgi:hypothetical protein